MIKTTSQSKFTFTFIISNSYKQIQNTRVRCHWLISVCVCLHKYPISQLVPKMQASVSEVTGRSVFVFCVCLCKYQTTNTKHPCPKSPCVCLRKYRMINRTPAYSTLATTFFPAKESKRERRLNGQCSAVFMNLNLRFTGSLLSLFTH